MTRSPRIGVCALYLSNFWVFKHYYIIFMDFSADFNGFCPLLGDLEPDLRPDLGGKLGD
jgi:hypothetical protein